MTCTEGFCLNKGCPTQKYADLVGFSDENLVFDQWLNNFEVFLDS